MIEIEGDWTELGEADFPEEFQGQWLDELTSQIAIEIRGRTLTYYGRPLKVGSLFLLKDGGCLAVRNEGPDEPADGWYWSGETLHILWLDSGNPCLNFHGIGDHGWALPSREKQ